MTSFEEQIKGACDAREIPGVVLLAVDKTGKLVYQKAFGPKSPTESMDFDTTFIFASCTKLMTSIAALQCVERGQIGLDDDVSSVLTELKDPQIITGYDEKTGEPILKKAENKITLRQLLTHTSGFTYDMMTPDITKWRTSKGDPPGMRGMRMLDRLQIPLLFEPGTSWIYGMSTDWAGLLVARLNKVTLEQYMQKNIWDPLGIKNITFHLELKPEVKKNKVTLTYREGIENPQYNLPSDTGKPVVWTDDLVYDDPIPIGDEFGGQGSVGSALEYSKILTSILLNDSKLLKPATVDLMFTPQLSDAPRAALGAFTGAAFWKDTFAGQPAGAKLDWGLAGCLTFDEKPTGRRAGTLTWSGLTNLLWTIDRDAGLATFYASNILPFGDQRSHKYQQMFEKEIYSRFGKTAKL